MGACLKEIDPSLAAAYLGCSILDFVKAINQLREDPQIGSKVRERYR